MSAIDTFNWLAERCGAGGDADTSRFFSREREALFALRSEDERQRFVDNLIREVKSSASGPKGR